MPVILLDAVTTAVAGKPVTQPCQVVDRRRLGRTHPVTMFAGELQRCRVSIVLTRDIGTMAEHDRCIERVVPADDIDVTRAPLS